jgi:NADH:ubiquinone oxidoreductase subunit 6 (subunit J)
MALGKKNLCNRIICLGTDARVLHYAGAALVFVLSIGGLYLLWRAGYAAGRHVWIPAAVLVYCRRVSVLYIAMVRQKSTRRVARWRRGLAW